MTNIIYKIVAQKLFSFFLQGVKGVVQLVELENPSDDNEQLTSKNKLELLTERPQGYSLEHFVNEIHRGGFGVLEAVQLVQILITIIKQVHSKGVFHQNLRPENITIEWNSKQTSMDQAELILLNFSQAYIKSEKTNRISQSEAGCWYKAPQWNVKSLKYSSTIDASNICAILLWLLTNTDPPHDQNLLPHRPNNVMDILGKKIAQAVRNAST
jgi:serine/threonine protein kinase